MCLLVEASHQDDPGKVQRIWDLLSDLYSANDSLSQLSEDRRRSHAAALLVAAWKSRIHKSSSEHSFQTPMFVVNLEKRLREAQMEAARTSGAGPPQQADTHVSAEPELGMTLEGLNPVFELDFQDIDWSFWSSMD